MVLEATMFAIALHETDGLVSEYELGHGTLCAFFALVTSGHATPSKKCALWFRVVAQDGQLPQQRLLLEDSTSCS